MQGRAAAGLVFLVSLSFVASILSMLAGVNWGVARGICVALLVQSAIAAVIARVANDR